jgi:DNA invertase Pin-like site-specific DNA recombinase
MTPAIPRTMAYLRVSTREQDLEKNKADILLLANRRAFGHVRFVEETVSGRVSWRHRQLAQVLEELQAGDRLVVSELSRLGRSMLECMEILALMARKGIQLYAVKGDWQLDGTMQSTIMAMVFAMAAEIERELIFQRTKEALRVKKAAGGRLGCPRGPGKSKLDQYQPEIEALLANGSTQKFIAKRYGTTEGNLYNWLKKRDLKPPKISSGMPSPAFPLCASRSTPNSKPYLSVQMPPLVQIVCCNVKRPGGNGIAQKFTFLGYEFRPRRVCSRQGKLFVSFTPAISPHAAKSIRQRIRHWRLNLQTRRTLEEVAHAVNPIVRGWIIYYGAYNRSSLSPILRHIDHHLVKWVKRKYKKRGRYFKRAKNWLGKTAQHRPELFIHWQFGAAFPAE